MHETLLPREFPGGRLRRMHARDCDAFQAYRSLPGLGLYQDWSPMSDAEARNYLEKMHRAPLFTLGKWVQLGIAESESDALVGDIGLYLSEDGASDCLSALASYSPRAVRSFSGASRAPSGSMSR